MGATVEMAPAINGPYVVPIFTAACDALTISNSLPVYFTELRISDDAPAIAHHDRSHCCRSMAHVIVLLKFPVKSMGGKRNISTDTIDFVLSDSFCSIDSIDAIALSIPVLAVTCLETNSTLESPWSFPRKEYE
jgi:hypothetical protein